MINIAVCDDEKLVRIQLDNIISNYLKTRKIDYIIKQFSKGIELIEACKQNDFSCIFLDIGLDSEDGIEVAKEIRKQVKQPIEIIFVTSYDDCHSKVISLHTFDYIVKPFKNSEIECVLDDYLLWHESKKSYDKKVQLKTIAGYITFSYSDILYLEYKNRRVEIHTRDEVFFMYARMKELYKIFENSDFVVPHVAYIINMNEIKKFYKSKNSVVMTNDEEIPISQLKAKEFRFKYKTFLLKNTEVR